MPKEDHLTPDQAILMMREQAVRMQDMATTLRARNPDDYDPCILLDWIIELLERGAEDKWATANLMRHFRAVQNFNTTRLLPAPSSENREGKLSLDTVHPPFDKDFWSGLPDL